MIDLSNRLNQCLWIFLVLFFPAKGVADSSQSSNTLANLTLACDYVKTRLDIRLSYIQGSEGKKVPCSVSYQRNGNQPVILWKTSENGEEGFCESRLKMFVDKLLDEDWACKETYVEPEKETSE